jgi:hypothetical protein
VIAGRVQARLYVMLDAWRCSPAERAALRKNLRGKTVVWCYAPGYFVEDQPSLGAMRWLTGFRLVPCFAAKAQTTPTEAGRSLGMSLAFGSDQSIRPLFAVDGLKPD